MDVCVAEGVIDGVGVCEFDAVLEAVCVPVGLDVCVLEGVLDAVSLAVVDGV